MANWITLSRLALVPAVLGISLSSDASELVLFAIVGCAAISDVGDGWAARRFSTVSTFGYYLDLTVDRVFVAACLVVLLQAGRLPMVLVGLILIREFFVLGLHGFAGAAGCVVPRTVAELLKAISIFAGIGICAVEPAIGRVILWISAGIAIAAGVELAVKVATSVRSLRTSSPIEG